MKKIILVIMLCAFGLGQAQNLEKEFGKPLKDLTVKDCALSMDKAETTYEMRVAFGCKLVILDNALNKVYQQVIKNSTPEFIEILRTDQRAWLKTNTDYFKNWSGEGSIAPVLKMIEAENFLENRIEYLEQFINNGFSEGIHEVYNPSGNDCIMEWTIKYFEKETGELVVWYEWCELEEECTIIIEMDGDYYLQHPKVKQTDNPHRTIEKVKFLGYGEACI